MKTKSLLISLLLLVPAGAQAQSTCSQLVALYEGSSYWWGAFGYCKQQPGGSVDPNFIYECAWGHVWPQDYNNACLKSSLRWAPTALNAIADVIAYNTPPSCDQRFAALDGSAFWWGAFGNLKVGYQNGGDTNPDVIFDKAFAQLSASDQANACLRQKLRTSSQTAQAITAVLSFNAPPSCSTLFANYDGSAYWQTAINNCDHPNGPTTTNDVVDCAFNQIPDYDRTPCLKAALAASSQTFAGVLTVLTHNGSVANNRWTYTPPVEGCDNLSNGVPAGYYTNLAPLHLLDSTPNVVPRFFSPAHIGTQEGRLTAELRTVAQIANPRECALLDAAILFARGRQDERARAFADLAVTGRKSFAAFVANLPKEDYCADLTTKTAPVSGCPRVGSAPDDASLRIGCERALDRAYEVANYLRVGETIQTASPWYTASGGLTTAASSEFDRKNLQRAALGWIAVSGEDDQPHRPVNAISSPSPQFEIDVNVPTPRNASGITSATVHARFTVAQSRAPAPVAFRSGRLPWPPPRWNLKNELLLNIAPGSEVVFFIHGMDSRAEEAEEITRALFRRMVNSQKNLVIITVDLPSSGYTQNIDYDVISPLSDIGARITIFDPLLNGQTADFYMTGRTPQLDFIEAFFIEFAQALNTRSPGLLSNVKAVMGGSLGGSMSLRLGRNTQTPWLPATVVWSPASIWESMGEGADRAKHVGPYMAFGNAADRLPGDPLDLTAGRLDQRQAFFDAAFDAPIAAGTIPISQPQSWMSNTYPCKDGAIIGARFDRLETYDGLFRAWRWRLATEQLLFSHQSIDPLTGQRRIKANYKRTLLACGGDDNVPFNGICSATQATAPHMNTTPGKAIFLNYTGHLVDIERPAFFAEQVDTFLGLQ